MGWGRRWKGGAEVYALTKASVFRIRHQEPLFSDLTAQTHSAWQRWCAASSETIRMRQRGRGRGRCSARAQGIERCGPLAVMGRRLAVQPGQGPHRP